MFLGRPTWLLTLGSACLALPGANAASFTAFRHVNVLTMRDDRVLQDQMVLIKGEIIASLAPDGSLPIPMGTRSIEGRGMFLMPGLIDAHTHPGGKAELSSFVRFGQTTIFTLNGEGKILRHVAQGIRPNILTSTTTIDGPGYILNTRFHVLRQPADASAVLDFEQRSGADFIKIYGQLDEQSVSALDKAGAERGLVIVGHLPRSFPLERSLPHIHVVAHTEEYLHLMSPDATEADLNDAADVTAANRVSVITTSVTMTGQPRHMLHLDQELADPERRFLSDETYQQWLPQNDRYATMSPKEKVGFANEVDLSFPKLKRLTFLLHERGVALLAGTDAPTFCYPGKCLLEELNILRESGLTNFEVLETATVNPSRFASSVAPKKKRFGIVAAGARADLILLVSNPLESLAALKDPYGVMVSGRWADLKAIDASRVRTARRLALSHVNLDRYEAFLGREDYSGLLAYLKDLLPHEVGFNANVVIDNAEAAQQAGKARDAVAMAGEFTRLLPGDFAVWNELGKLRGIAGDQRAACAAYVRSLKLKPLNGTALAGLRNMTARCEVPLGLMAR